MLIRSKGSSPRRRGSIPAKLLIWIPAFAGMTILLLSGCKTPQEEIKKYFYSGGILKDVLVYINGKLNGISRHYNTDGILQEAIEYRNGEIEGMRNIYYPTGALWAKEIYENGKLIKRIEFDEEGFIRE